MYKIVSVFCECLRTCIAAYGIDNSIVDCVKMAYQHLQYFILNFYITPMLK